MYSNLHKLCKPFAVVHRSQRTRNCLERLIEIYINRIKLDYRIKLIESLEFFLGLNRINN